MGFSFRKSIKLGPARINLSKSGVGYSIGAGGLRYTKSPKRKAASKRKISSGGLLGRIIGYGLLLLALLGLAVSYWKWVVGVLAVVAACVVALAIYKKKKVQAKEPSKLATEEENNPVP